MIAEVVSTDILDVSDPLNFSITSDFDSEVDKQLVALIQGVNDLKIPSPVDMYKVSVSLKDDSIFMYAPRRFAWSERLQIKEITDDLLKREIIKPSCSPYCARVVPVCKKNGFLRLYVDLCPLNERVIKQKYPFPLIEDCLAKLSNKSIFSLLDLKDGFHQIDLHPDHTKYFSFATPDGQFEFLKLPFGFCETPAEFQKRIVQILQPLIRQNKIIVYIDDILIPSNSIQDNLATLKEYFIQTIRISAQFQ